MIRDAIAADSLAAGLKRARERLPRAEADVLTALAFDVPRSTLYAFPERTVNAARQFRHRDWLRRRQAGEPLAYITGRREFWNLDLAITPAVLVPRHETELLVEFALAHCGERGNVLDLGTGSGAVALAIKHSRPALFVSGADIDPACVALAQQNAKSLELTVTFVVADWFDGVAGAGHYDVIVANPPYVSISDSHLRGPLRFEPRLALVSGEDGLHAISSIIPSARRHLVDGGWLAVEHGFDQADAVTRLFHGAGYQSVATKRDLAGHGRITAGRFQAATVSRSASASGSLTNANSPPGKSTKKPQKTMP